MDSGVVAEMTTSGATGCTQPVPRKRRLEHGLGTTRGTQTPPTDSRTRTTTPQSIMSLVVRPGAEPSRRLPRVDDEGPARFEVLRVAGHDVQPVTQGGGRKEAVGGRNDDTFLLSPGGKLAPNPGGLDVEF